MQPLPFQTPAKSLYFVGRRQQIASLREQLTVRSGTANICSLVGMGGVGKTTLAIYLADQLRDVFTDGVLWANVTISDPMDVLESWARAYGYDFTSLADLESRSAAWRGALGEKKVLIVLDNATNAARVRPLLPNNSHSAVLLTTRDLDLARSLNTRVTLLTELSPANSQQLLAQILGEERIAAEPKAAVAICALLQHLPLAIEIIGQRLKSRPRRLLSAVANRLQAIDNRLAELEISDRAVRASFQVSWETLDAELRRIFALLAVFAGRSFTAVVLAGIDESDVYLVEDRLFTLTALSLVKEENPNRYRQHSLLADFASEKLGQSPDIYIRMAQYYQTFARTHQQNYEALRPEWDNLTAALKIAHQYEQWPLVMEYAKILHVAWFARGRYSEAQYGSQLAYQAAELTQAHKAKARFTYQWARALVEQSQYNEAQQLLRNNLEQYMALADNEGIAKVYYELARIGMEQAQLDEAEQLLRKSKQLRKSIGDSVGVAETIEGQARLFYKRGNYQAAHQHSLEALSCYEIADYQPGIVTTLRLLANSVIELHKQDDGDLGLAISYGQRALRLAEALQDRGEQAVTLYVLSRVHMLQNEFQQAEETGEQSLTLLEHIGDQRSQAIILTHLGEVHYSQGKYETALDLTYRSLSLCQKLKIDLETAVALSNIGVYYHCLGQLHKAKESWKKALPLAQALGHASLVVRIQKRLHAD